MRHRLSTVALGPVLLWQGWRTRQRTPRLPEPPGERTGLTGDGPSLRLLVLGDSAAAGVGAPHQDQALTGQLVSRLAPHFNVDWTLNAVSGATTLATLARLDELAGQRFDVVTLSLGVNDVTAGIARATWRRHQADLHARLRDSFAARLLVVAGLPPVHGFPALPQPLRWYLGHRARQFTGDLQSAIDAAPDAVFVDLHFTEDPDLMASDGFHPGPDIYAEWARRVADRVLEVFGDDAEEEER